MSIHVRVTLLRLVRGNGELTDLVLIRDAARIDVPIAKEVVLPDHHVGADDAALLIALQQRHRKLGWAIAQPDVRGQEIPVAEEIILPDHRVPIDRGILLIELERRDSEFNGKPRVSHISPEDIITFSIRVLPHHDVAVNGRLLLIVCRNVRDHVTDGRVEVTEIGHADVPVGAAVPHHQVLPDDAAAIDGRFRLIVGIADHRHQGGIQIVDVGDVDIVITQLRDIFLPDHHR